MLQISPQIFQKFETALIGFSGALGKQIHKNLKSKSRDTVPLNVGGVGSTTENVKVLDFARV